MKIKQLFFYLIINLLIGIYFRYLVLDHMVQERTQILMAYLEDLHKRGPPPPPTASESTRRK